MQDDMTQDAPGPRAPTLIRGGRPLPPRLLYLGMQSVDALLFSMAYTTIYGLYAVKAVGLGPLALTLVGTLMESAIFLGEVPTGIVADTYGRRLSMIIGLFIIGAGIALSGAHQAWLADAIGAVQAASVYMRATQLSHVGNLIGILLSVTLAGVHLQLPLWASGVGFWGLA